LARGSWAYGHKRLPESQKDDNARSAVAQVAGVVSLLLALVLGTLVGTSFAFFGTQKTEIETLSSQILLLDQALAQYGPETKPARDRLKEAAQTAYATFWGGGEPDPKLLSVALPLASAQATKTFLASLKPETDLQKQAVASANVLAGQIIFAVAAEAIRLRLVRDCGRERHRVARDRGMGDTVIRVSLVDLGDAVVRINDHWSAQRNGEGRSGNC
jgi:hypothetical protein